MYFIIAFIITSIGLIILNVYLYKYFLNKSKEYYNIANTED